MIDDTCSAQWLCDQLCSSTDAVDDVLVLDCRSADEYADAHVAGSLPVVVPSIMLRRLRNGISNVAAVVSGDALARTLFTERYRTSHIVLYDAAGDVIGSHDGAADSVVQVLMNRLKKDGCRVSYLLGTNTPVSLVGIIIPKRYLSRLGPPPSYDIIIISHYSPECADYEM